MDNIFYEYFFRWMMKAAFGYCRIAPVFFLVPFLNTGNVPSVVRMPVIFFLSMLLVPEINVSVFLNNFSILIVIVIKELMIGLGLGLILSLPFWIFHAIGSFIDNQRGATLSSSLDPSSGVDTSELAKFLNLFAVVIYIENNGVLHLVSSIYYSYSFMDPQSLEMPSPAFFTEYLTKLVSDTIRISSPVIAVMLGCEFYLGLLSRYSSQLNAFAVSMTLKSGLAFLVMLLYFYPAYTDNIISLMPDIRNLTFFSSK